MNDQHDRLIALIRRCHAVLLAFEAGAPWRAFAAHLLASGLADGVPAADVSIDASEPSGKHRGCVAAWVAEMNATETTPHAPLTVIVRLALSLAIVVARISRGRRASLGHLMPVFYVVGLDGTRLRRLWELLVERAAFSASSAITRKIARLRTLMLADEARPLASL
jgi:hypothetical protein